MVQLDAPELIVQLGPERVPDIPALATQVPVPTFQVDPDAQVAFAGVALVLASSDEL